MINDISSSFRNSRVLEEKFKKLVEKCVFFAELLIAHFYTIMPIEYACTPFMVHIHIYVIFASVSKYNRPCCTKSQGCVPDFREN